MSSLEVRQTTTIVHEYTGAVDLHEEANRSHACGFEHDLKMHAWEAAKVAARLRGISAITTVLRAEDGDAVVLGGGIRHGLFEAIDALSNDASDKLHAVNYRAAKGAAR